MGRLKTKKPKSTGRGGRLVQKAIDTVTGKKGQGKKRNRGPTYWANKVLVEKLKKRYHRLKYGGAR